MPTENERKFIIDISCEKNVNELSSEQYFISQGYLISTRGITTRIRKSVKNSNGSESYYFTLKVNTNGRCVEIENKLDQRDFNDLWSITLNQLEKIRYIIKHEKNIWEIDFFKDYKNQTYMAVAEVELPEDQMEPESIPNIIKKNLLFKVPLTDNRFSNKLISNAKYAAELLNEILEGKKNEV
jgi:CYTH domain-containing protein